MAAKAYRLLRAVLDTAVEEDKILPRNPCRVRGAGEEHAAERPVLTVAQVFELAEQVGRRPVGNIRKLPAGGYRLRFRRNGEMRTSPEVYGTRADAERALWKMAGTTAGPTCHQDRRFRALVLLATFASLRWGEVTALTAVVILTCKQGPCPGAGRVHSAAVQWVSDRPGTAQVEGRAEGRRHPQVRSSRLWSSTWPSLSGRSQARWCSAARTARRCGGATSTRCRAWPSRGAVDRGRGPALP